MNREKHLRGEKNSGKIRNGEDRHSCKGRETEICKCVKEGKEDHGETKDEKNKRLINGQRGNEK